MTDSSNKIHTAPLRGSRPERIEDRPKKQKAKRPAPISVRVSVEERAELLRRAGSLSLSAYIRRLVLGDEAIGRRQRVVPVDRVLLAKVLAALASSRLIDHVRILAEAAEVGNLYVDERMKAVIKRACDDVGIMRQALLMALGKQKPEARIQKPEERDTDFRGWRPS